ncbi:hypothetical protein A1O3_05388 [Capronia epimyces CBS 606.96]|uniref:DUF7702 domain-containing protein n=1 Tax=Capronia epimyces CBS 606.96 TaxID=1182542 RepID=W9XWV1_9EURO|nr:uncharacterized protein A1O3_05388 [Capronia epimyces CBS 606.96]EXJ84718.1 hypothetical protein A1O3_05388 [Capronia epimyces CBS 606.96]
MGLSAPEILSIIELIFFAPAILVSVYVVYKHGHQRQYGWRFLVLICLFRLIAGITQLVSVHHPSSGLTICYDIMNSFGISAIVYAALGLLNRVDHGISQSIIPRRAFALLGLPGLAGVVLCIVGSINVFGGGSNPSEGIAELKAGFVLFSSVYLADVLIAAICFFNIAQVQSGDRRLLLAVAAALPFMTVRVVFSLLCVFAQEPKYFSTWTSGWVAVLVHGLLGILMEAIIVSIFIAAGLTTAPIRNPTTQQKETTLYGPEPVSTKV